MSAANCVQLALLFSTIVEGLHMECFSYKSNANWLYYMERIPGLKALNSSETLPVAPLACTFDPMRIYADRTAVACKGYCVKWASVRILDDDCTYPVVVNLTVNNVDMCEPDRNRHVSVD
ncbi:hypothetical protein KIN20_019395 [Parelaphostrongylus tenuis]|uniref:Secreted protein n=1 Tax=Parelaphostrongylus tenuis TaxID=148309 RepID=A0AAD5QV23_PARTN|nr:hypothetical protein KIN20_019395 [Parelaphostrongylus tenuis]